MTISYRVRKQIVDYFAQRKSSQEIASMLNVSLDQIQDWRRRYKHGHEDWVFSDHQKFSIQERKEILVDFLVNRSTESKPTQPDTTSPTTLSRDGLRR